MAKWTYRQFNPQPARGAFDVRYLVSKDWVAEEKYDGDRRIAQFCGEAVRFSGRHKSVKDGLFVEKTENLPHLSYSIDPDGAEDMKLSKRVEALTGTVLDGEIIVPEDFTFMKGEGRSKFVTSIMGSAPDVAIEKQAERGWLVYVVFDCLFYKGQDVRKLTYRMRRERVKEVLEQWRNPYVMLAAQSSEIDVEYTPKRMLADLWAKGREGVILKHVAHRYGNHLLWVKKKMVANYDVVIMGYKAAKDMSTKVNGDVSVTKYAAKGWIGAIRCGQYRDGKLWECATISGIDEKLRKELSLHGDKYIGKVVELKANGREPSGRFRHPQFAGFRPDKSAKQCTYRKNEE